MSGAEVERLLSHLIHLALIRREVLSALRHLYDFVRDAFMNLHVCGSLLPKKPYTFPHFCLWCLLVSHVRGLAPLPLQMPA